MRGTPEVENIYSKCMRADAITKKVEVSFAKEFNSLLYLRDEIGTKGDKKHVTRKAKAHLNHKYYWVHKEKDIIFNGIKDVYNILNNQDKVTWNTFIL